MRLMTTDEVQKHLETHHMRNTPAGAAAGVHHQLHANGLSVGEVNHIHEFPDDDSVDDAARFLGQVVQVRAKGEEPNTGYELQINAPEIVFVTSFEDDTGLFRAVRLGQDDLIGLPDKQLALLAGLIDHVSAKVYREQRHREKGT